MAGESFTPFLRRVEALVGPFAEHVPQGEEFAKRFYGDGTPDNLRIKFAVKKHIISTATPTTISIYNLSEGTRNDLQKPDIRILLNVGWENTPLIRIFQGSILAAPTVREGADLITTIYALSAFSGLSRSTVSASYAEGWPIKEIVIELAKEIEGVSVDPKKVDITAAATGSAGWNSSGRVEDQLNDLARVYGFSWTVEDGSFKAIDDARAYPGFVLANASTGLKRAEPKLVAPFQKTAGASISSILNPYIETGTRIRLESIQNPALNTDYKITTLDHIGDTHSAAWDSNIESWLIL